MTDQTRGMENLIASTNKTVFTTSDFNKAWRYTNYRSLIKRINYLKKSGKIDQIQRGLYSIHNRSINEFELANKLRTPSYISFETVLHRDGIIFQWDKRITLASKESSQFKIDGQNILFRQVKDSILLNKTAINGQDNYYIATKERALLDMLYINSVFQFDNLRSIDFEIIENLIPIYEKKNLFKVVERLKEYAKSY